ncbi:MAG TPA: 4'-phosphopantetheinyl transferase superfamily protein, partial [Candidatus Obscuribacterales bacterium]
VVTVILAEWALFRLLERLGIKADAVLGVSTGEFAALTIGGAANILDAAPLFYKLSTAVAKAVPVEELARLRSIKVSHPLEEIEPIINKLEHPVYLGADLSPAQVLLSGTKEAMELAQKELKRNSLEVFALPTAIPYHTPLVSGKVSSTDEEVGRFSLSSPSIPIWGCSVVGKYPGDEAALKEVTTKLFTRPIHFRRTIESMYADGVRKFVEVGPKGSLSAIINEILGEQPHLSVASNLSTTSAITQLNRMLAALSCHGVQMDLAYIFERRDCRLIDFSKEKLDARSPSTIRLSLKYPEIALDNIPELPNLRSVAETAAAVSTPAAVSKPDAVSTPAAVSAPDAVSAPKAVSAPDAASISILPLHPQEQIMTSYLADLTTFHRNLLSVQAQVLSAYLARSAPSQLIDPAYCGAPTAEAAATGSASAENGSQNFISRYPLLASALVRKSQSGEIEVLLPLTLTTHQYLLDHAIGGNVLHNGTMPERVYLVPLTVALEMMTEVASLLAPGMVPVKIEAVRALRRIRVTGEGLTLRLVVREEPGHSNAIASAIYIVDAEAYGKSIEHMPGHPSSQTEPAMSCTVWFASAYQAAAPATIPEVANGREARIAGPSLYTDTTMFHGPRMQSVVALEKVGDKTISGYVAARKAAGWLADANGAYGAPPAFQIDPLLLDNSTQLVLYHLFEQNDNVSALLPFHIDSLELFADLSALSGQAKVWANVKSRNSIGTEADVEIYSPANHLLARFNSISSKRISLPERWKSFIAHPAAVSLGIPAADVLSLLPTDGKDCYECTEVSDALLPADEATLVWLTDYLLHPKEQSLLAALSDRRRKREWLAGRIAAKDAIRQLVARKFGRQIPPANIVVQTTESGTPYSHVALAGNSQAGFALSITHKNGLAIALAKLHLDDQPTAIGIDFEPIVHRESSFERFVVGHNEQSFLKGVTGNTRLEALTALWCAKEAAGKALGVGLSNNPRKLEAKRIDLESQHALFEGNLSDDAASPSKVVDVRWLKREAGIIASAVASLRLFAP